MNNSSEIFEGYAKYYDLLYKDKDYFSESEYILKIIERLKPKSKNILDLGCGTGIHDIYLSKKKFDVTGVELSNIMVNEANKNLNAIRDNSLNMKFLHGDIRHTKLESKFDIIISLFHVMSYQVSNEDVDSTLKTVKNHLKEDGKFIFDFWYGPAVLNERPKSRIKKFNDEKFKIERYASPEMRINENIVDVNYKVMVNEKANNQKQEIREKHSMRYFFLPEIKLFLENNNLKLLQSEEWMSRNELSDTTWNALVIAGNK